MNKFELLLGELLDFIREKPDIKAEELINKIVTSLMPFRAKLPAHYEIDDSVRQEVESIFVNELNFVKGKVGHIIQQSKYGRRGGAPVEPTPLAGVTYNQKTIDYACIITALARTLKIVFCNIFQRSQPTPFTAKLLDATNIIESLKNHVTFVGRTLDNLYGVLHDQGKTSFASYILATEETVKKYIQ